MLEFINELFMFNEVATRATAWEVLFAIGISFLLALLITWTYAKTYRGATNTQSFMQTLVIMSVVITVIIIVIGSNIARAFSLAGALSIIRFRSAIRDPKDVAFIFFAMGSGLACGTGLYLPAIAFVVFLCALILALHALNYGGSEINKVLKIAVPENLNYEGMFDDVLEEFLEFYNLVSVRTTDLGTMFELTYVMRVKPGASNKDLLDAIRTRNANLQVSIMLGPNDVQY